MTSIMIRMSWRIRSVKIGKRFLLPATFLTRPQVLDRDRYPGRGCRTMKNLSLSAKIMIGLVLGILTGLFFGERAGFLGMAGQAFLLLLQMTVLPYIVIALIKGIGGMDFKVAWTLARKAGIVLLVIWILTLCVILLFPLSFPEWESASFFSRTLVESSGEFDFISMFIPANPFGALAENAVPAAVFFSVALGIALIGIGNKKDLLAVLDTLGEALGRISTFVVRLAPYGVFALLAHASGTIEFSQLQGLQVYVATYLAGAAIIIFWIMPGLIMTLTPIGYKSVIRRLRDALVTGFATGNLFVVLPILAKRSKELLQKIEGTPEEASKTVDVIAPTAFTFPSAGKLLCLGFVLFAGWMTGFPIPFSKYFLFAVAGFFTWFGSTLVSVPFMLDTFRIPSDAFQIFLIVDNIFGRFGVTVGVIHIATLSVLGSAAVAGAVRLRPLRIARYLVLTVLIVTGVFTGIRMVFTAIGTDVNQYELFVKRSYLFESVEHRVAELSDLDSNLSKQYHSALTRIRATGTIRVGYTKDALPWAFMNDKGELVGLDVELLHTLARELEAKIVFVRIEQEKAPGLLNGGVLDILIGGQVTNTADLDKVTFSAPYLDKTWAFIVEDYRREDFNTEEALRAQSNLKIGITGNRYFVDRLQKYLPDAEIVPLESPRQFFRAEKGAMDALLLNAEAGSSWCLIYPQYTVAVPHPVVRTVPMAFTLAFGDNETAELLNSWIELKKRDGTISDLFDYWIAGKNRNRGGERWSVIRDVLGWVD